MKKSPFLILVFLLSLPLCAEKHTFRTGDAFALSLTDYFFPVDISMTGSRCSITSIKKVEKDLWCLSLAAFRTGQMTVPIVYEYYVKPGDILKLRRLESPMEECDVKIVSIGWNFVEIEM